MAWRIASTTRSGVIGSSKTRVPMASATALAIAGAAGVRLGSPTPLAPKGPTPLRDSRMMLSISGVSMAVGIRYSLNDGVTSRPSSYFISSMSA